MSEANPGNSLLLLLVHCGFRRYHRPIGKAYAMLSYQIIPHNPAMRPTKRSLPRRLTTFIVKRYDPPAILAREYGRLAAV